MRLICCSPESRLLQAFCYQSARSQARVYFGRANLASELHFFMAFTEKLARAGGVHEIAE
jgi:hypothetical protein